MILTRWNPLFADIPVESMIYADQAQKMAKARVHRAIALRDSREREAAVEDLKKAIVLYGEVDDSGKDSAKELLEKITAERELLVGKKAGVLR